MGNSVSTNQGDFIFLPSMSIDDLPDGALLLIFELLPLRDRLSVERVSKRWLELSRLLWPKIKEFDMTKQKFAYRHSLGLKMEERVADVFITFLRRMRSEYSGVTSLKLVGGCFLCPRISVERRVKRDIDIYKSCRFLKSILFSISMDQFSNLAIQCFNGKGTETMHVLFVTVHWSKGRPWVKT